MKTKFNLKIKLIKFVSLFFLLPSFGSLFPDTFQGFGQRVNAQTIDVLLNSEWILQDSEVNGNSINLSVLGASLIPDNFGDFSFIFEYGTISCLETFKINFTDVTESSFNLSTIFEYVSCNYTDPDEIDAVELYQSFYFEFPFDTNSTPKNPFTYEWVDATPFADELKITNNQGDWLLYQTYTLSTPTFHQNSFTLYPNPVKETLHINNGSNQNVIATIFDLSGKELQKHSFINSNKAIDIKALNSGLYFIVFENELGEQVSKKFVKQ